MNKLEIGAGDSRLPGYKTSDIRPGCDYQCTAWDIHKIEGAEYWDKLYACMVLEHVPRNKQAETLSRWWWALKFGGELEIIVPNMKYIAMLLASNNIEVQKEGIRLAYGDQDYPENTHVWGFTIETLSFALCEAGFMVVEEKDLPSLYMKVVK